MKIRNDLVAIKIGNKQYDLKNLILNDYLRRFTKSQINKDNRNFIPDIRELKYCLLKFDTPIKNLNENSELHNQDFDVVLLQGISKVAQEISEKEVFIKYTYRSDWKIGEFNNAGGINNEKTIKDFYGKKITAIGFNSYFGSDKNLQWKVPVCAVLDVSNYNIYLQENQELTITRKDIISTDALFWSDSDKIKGPIHLAPIGMESLIKQDDFVYDNGLKVSINERAYGILYSVGFSSFQDWIDKEYVIGKDIQVVNNNNELIIEGLDKYFAEKKGLYPSILLLPNYAIYPSRANYYDDIELYPSKSLYSNSKVYPTKCKYKYAIFKYKIWQDIITFIKDEDGGYEQIRTPKDTGFYYYQAIKLDENKIQNLKIKYERS